MIASYLDAMAAEKYEIKLIRHKKHVITRKWTATEILNNSHFLSEKNRQKFNVYARPLDDRYVLLDDLVKEMLKQVAIIKPCILMETSPKNYQVWLRIPNMPKDRNQQIKVWRTLASEFKADLKSAKPLQLGRLPGFINQKPDYEPDNPLVKLHGSENRESTWNPLEETLTDIKPPSSAIANQRKGKRDRSAYDWAVAMACIEKGWSDSQTIKHLRKHSHKAKERKDNYLERTVENARRTHNSKIKHR